MYTEWVTGKLVYFDRSHPDKFLFIYLKHIPLKIKNYILSIIHVSTCFDSKCHHEANHWTKSKVTQVTVHI